MKQNALILQRLAATVLNKRINLVRFAARGAVLLCAAMPIHAGQNDSWLQETPWKPFVIQSSETAEAPTASGGSGQTHPVKALRDVTCPDILFGVKEVFPDSRIAPMFEELYTHCLAMRAWERRKTLEHDQDKDEAVSHRWQDRMVFVLNEEKMNYRRMGEQFDQYRRWYLYLWGAYAYTDMAEKLQREADREQAPEDRDADAE